MHKANFSKLMEDSKVYYIYNLGLPIFGVEGKDFYIIVTSEDWVGTLETSDIQPDDIQWTRYTIKEWFQMVEDCSIITWMCACLNKKYIIKEYVKLLMETNPLKMRIQYQKYTNSKEFNSLNSKMEHLAFLKFYNQILVNHKIVNFHTIGDDFKAILEASESKMDQVYSDKLSAELKLFYRTTDGIYKNYKIEKWKKQQEKLSSSKDVLLQENQLEQDNE